MEHRPLTPYFSYVRFGINMYYSYYYQNAVEEMTGLEEFDATESEKKLNYEEILKLISDIQSGVEQSGVE